MARRGPHRLWLTMAVVAAAIGLAGGFGGPVDLDPLPHPAGHASAADGLVAASTGVDVAVVPLRTEAGASGTRSAADPTGNSPVRWLLPLVAALLGLAGLVGARSGVVGAPAAGRPPLRARRHTIALRAPPSLRFA